MVGLIGNAHGAETRLDADCHLRAQGESSSFECGFRSREPKAVKRVELTANGDPLDGVSFQSFSDGDGKAAWLFLIDRSNPRRAATVRRSVELVEDLYARSNARNIMAVATFAGEMQVLISPGDPYADVAERLKDVRADGAATAFYFTALQAIDVLKGVDAERRALVIISDGKAEDTAYTHADVIKKVKETGVVIYGIGFAEKPSETVDLQQVERLASETGGPFVSAVGDAPLPASFLYDFTNYLTNGGSVSAPSDDISGEISLALKIAYDDGASSTSEEFSLYKEPSAPVVVTTDPPPPAPPLPLIGKIYKNFEDFWPQASDWAAQNSAVAWVLLAAVLLFLLSRSKSG
ncbi:VWA domain-containing protein [Breoghania sp.]|uniref:vWA domain-containing protein n=1 Tax=Breoghania sp. TaxID=2065378 RepID=UPI0026240857|nr:VWA domain-containing protein [Breoghania sp.]MDJ0930644.1 VWA domain-containing protein [Breoghania sp.]